MIGTGRKGGQTVGEHERGSRFGVVECAGHVVDRPSESIPSSGSRALQEAAQMQFDLLRSPNLQGAVSQRKK